jgi:hypothetical protein
MLLIASPEDSTTGAINYAGMGLRDINGVVEHSIPRVNGADEEMDEHRFVLLLLIMGLILTCFSLSPQLTRWSS